MVIFTYDSDGFVGFNVHFVFGDFLEFGLSDGELLGEFGDFDFLRFQGFLAVMELLNEFLHFLGGVKGH